jgi:hypothetical protein
MYDKALVPAPTQPSSAQVHPTSKPTHITAKGKHDRRVAEGSSPLLRVSPWVGLG